MYSSIMVQISTVVKETFVFVMIFMVYSVVQGISLNTYVHFCAPKTTWDYFIIALYNQTPQCRILHWIFTTSHSMVDKLTSTTILWTTKLVTEKLIWNGNKVIKIA